MIEKYSVKTADLTRQCADDPFDFTTTADLDPLDSVIGQRRAVEAIQFGLEMTGPGYNIFITGYEGTGKSTITREILTAFAKKQDTPDDMCLVNNFDDPYCPKVMKLPTGSAVFFSRRMTQFIETLKVKLPQAFDNKAFQEKQDRIQKEFIQKQKELMSQVEAFAANLDIGIVETEQGHQAVPVKDGEPVSAEQLKEYDSETKAAVEKNLTQVQAQMNDVFKQLQNQAKKIQQNFQEMIAAMADTLFAKEMDLAFADFKNCPEARQFLEDTKNDMKENIPLLLKALDSESEKGSEAAGMAEFLEKRYQVNVLVDRRGEHGAPVIFEPAPTFQNLFGKIERIPAKGLASTDFTMVQAGSILRADKGFLMLEIDSLLRNSSVWETLKTTLQNKKLYIQDAPDQTFTVMASLRPDPIPIDVKVILVGRYEIFLALQGSDPKFNKIFKVRADFDHEVDLNQENLRNYARFVARACKYEKLPPFTPCGVSAIVAYGNRIAENKNKLSLRFGRILDMLKEAAFWAQKNQAPAVTGDHVVQAQNACRFRHNLFEEKIQEKYDDHSILINLTGSVVGQVNALAVYQIGDLAFGRPSRITAESYMGKPGIINVEHEAELSGQTHRKGMMIVAGYLGRMFAQNHPLSISVSITFEQSYGSIEGDSASSTELYAVLSSLSGYPIRQGIAVTGSVSQKGEIQPIGGVNEKIEGFFDVCSAQGLTGDQGVMIPSANVNNLMVKNTVKDAVDQGLFHIYQISNIEEGIEVLTGVPAGRADESFVFPEGTVFGAVQAKLKRFHDRSLLCTR